MSQNRNRPGAPGGSGRDSRVRPAAPADEFAVRALVDAIFHEHGFALALDGVDAYLCEPCGYFRSRGGEFWVLDRDCEIVGAVGVLLPDEDVGELKSLYVHSSIRNRGWGTRLVTLVINFAKEANRRRLILWSDTRFTEAHRLYRRLGFSQIGERDLHDAYLSREYGFSRNLD